jgi:hypothetical protein
MNKLRSVWIILALAAGTAAADPVDGTAPLVCSADRGHDCLPARRDCDLLQPQKDKLPVFHIDFVGKQVRSPFRTALLHVTHTTATSESLILQGTDLLFAWSALIKKKDGALTIAISDREGAYIVFGNCKVAPLPAPASK